MTSQQRQTIHSIHNKKFWSEFFSLYESLPALWDVNNPLYKNRQVKRDAYDTMVDKLREIESNADREDVLRKINIFRTNYRRECSRIALSLQEGRQYNSTLWYFDLLNFLPTADTRKERKRKLLDDEIEKSIMRKPRNIHKHTNSYMLSIKKGEIVEYQPHSANATDIDCDNYEDPDFDYIVEDINHTMSDNKSEGNECDDTIQMSTKPFQDLNNDDHDDDNSQTEYENDYKNFTLRRNSDEEMSAANSHATDLVGVTSTIDTNAVRNMDDGGGIIMPDPRMHKYDEYDNEASAADVDNDVTMSHDQEAQWCIKITHGSKSVTMALPNRINMSKHEVATSTTSNTSKMENNCHKISTKLVRDVCTMTSEKFNDVVGALSETSEILAKSWAIQYEEMSQKQKLLARKAINDILFDGCMGQLAIGSNSRVISCNSTLMNKNQKFSKAEFESGEMQHLSN